MPPAKQWGKILTNLKPPEILTKHRAKILTKHRAKILTEHRLRYFFSLS